MRLPFDPGRMAPGPGESPAKAKPSAAPCSVSDLAARIAESLGAGFPSPVRVVGEVSGFKPNSHWYFSLKDAGAVIACVMFAHNARTARFAPSDGQQVIVTGRPDYWAKGGRTSFVVTKIEPVGQGALDAAFRALCDELRRLGWFDPSRKRPIPRFPRRVAVVTAASGAAIQDVLATMRRRCPAVEVAVVDVPVQGEGAAFEVARAIRWLGRERLRLGIDVILVTRGGGSKEDLWTFNERSVAEAIVQSPVPVVAAIGHEVDVTIAELVADERAATPTQAAMKITPDTGALLEQLTSSGSILGRAIVRVVRDRRQSLTSAQRHLITIGPGRLRTLGRTVEELAHRLERQRPAAVYERRSTMLREATRRLASAMALRLSRVDLAEPAVGLRKAWLGRVRGAGDRLGGLERQLAAVGPMSVLKRGYSVTTHSDGSLVRSPADVRPGERITTRVAAGEFRSTVEDAGATPAPPAAPRAKPATPPVHSPAGPPVRSPGAEPPQMDLFRPDR